MSYTIKKTFSLVSFLGSVSLLLSIAGYANETSKPTPTKLEAASHSQRDIGLWGLIVRSQYTEAKIYIDTHNVDINAGDGNGETILMYAAKGNNIKHVEFLLNNGAKLNLLNDRGTALSAVCTGYIAKGDNYNNSIKIAKLLIKKGANLDVINAYGQSPLLAAVAGNKTEIVELLVDAGADVNIQTPKTLDTPLMVAVKKNHIESVAILITSDINLEQKNADKESALDLSIEKKHPESLALLLEAGVDTTALNKMNMNALMYVSYKRSNELVTVLLQHGVDVNQVNSDKMTALMFASSNADVKITQMLIDNKANLDLVNSQGQTALMLAELSSYKDAETVSISLIQAGANINLVDDKGNSALMLSSKNRRLSVAKLLIHKGAKTDLINLDNKTSYEYTSRNCSKIASEIKHTLKKYQPSKEQDLVYAAYKGNKNKLKKLLKKGYALNSIDEHGKTALMYALENRKYSAAYKMVNQGADVNLVDTYGRSALFYAVEARSDAVVQKLLEKGANVNLKDSSSREAILLVKDEKSLELLLAKGADINTKNASGWTLLMISSAKGKNNIVVSLLKHNADKTIHSLSGKTALEIAKEKGQMSNYSTLL